MCGTIALYDKDGERLHTEYLGTMSEAGKATFGQRLDTHVYFFFFSSRRRHTRFDCDWSSDVCSSDLVRDGRVVKGVQFQHLRDAGDPASQAALYESQGADEIVLLDVAASAEGRATQLETVARVRAAIRIPLTVGSQIGRAHV